MLLTNAEVHADNPEFQRDMLATVRASVGKITRLLTRLQAERQERDHALITPAERLRDIVAATRQITRQRDDRAVRTTAAAPAWRSIRRRSTRSCTHLLNNAVEASGAGTPVRVDAAA